MGDLDRGESERTGVGREGRCGERGQVWGKRAGVGREGRCGERGQVWVERLCWALSSPS